MDAPRPTSGYESGMFKPGDKASDGSVFLGETEDGSPLWSEPVDAPRPTSDLAADIAAGIEANLDGAQARAKARLAHEALVARVTDLEARLAKGWDEVVAEDKARAIRAEIRAEAAEAQVAALTQERDEYAERLAWHRDERDVYLKGNLWVGRAADEQRRAEAAEDALAEARQALQEIIDRHERPCGVHESPLPCDVALAETYAIARRALAATEEPA